MTTTKEIFKILNNRLCCSGYNFRLFQKPKLFPLLRFYSNKSNKTPMKTNENEIQTNEEKGEFIVYEPESYIYSEKLKYWNEKAAIKTEKRLSKFPHSINSATDLIKFFQSFNDYLNIFQYLKKRHVQNQLIEQKYLSKRVAYLKPDLAAAHFLVRRGGSIKFKGNPDWIGHKYKKYYLPVIYVPGMFIEAIDAEGTELYIEGLQNLKDLYYLSYLSLKNLSTVDDWFLDFVSKEYSMNLKHLNISGCKNVTYRGLSCFYRFEKLKVLEVEGIPDTPEFKLACLMLLEIKPFLDIKGIDLSVPKEIQPTFVENKLVEETSF